MPPKSSVIRSPYRKEIEEMIIEGKSSRFISTWLKDHDEKISHTAINNYRKGDFNIKDEAAREYVEKQSKKRKTKAVNDQVSDIEKIDKFLEKVDPEIMSRMEPKDQVRNVNNLLKTKYQILGVIDEGKSSDVNVNVKIVHKEKMDRLKRMEENESDQPVTSRAKLEAGTIKNS